MTSDVSRSRVSKKSQGERQVNFRIAYLFVASGLAALAVSFAQNARAAEESSVQEVIVTARRGD